MATSTKTLVLIFQNQGGEKVRFNIDNAREDIGDDEVKTAMETLIAKNIFDTKKGDLVQISGAEVITKSVEEFIVK
jgi:hypothetical protein